MPQIISRHEQHNASGSLKEGRTLQLSTGSLQFIFLFSLIHSKTYKIKNAILN